MPRLPQPGQDAGTWGSILNDYLSQSHAADGSLKADAVGTTHLQAASITSTKLAPGAVTTATLTDGSVTAAKVAADVATQAALDAVASAKANTVHSHAAADVTSGTLPLARGGTGGTDATSARSSLGLGSAATMTPATLAADVAFTDAYASALSVRDVDTVRATALRTYHASLANRYYAPCDILFIGDSITEGQGATTYGRRWIDVLRKRLQTYYAVPGVIGGSGYIPSRNTGGFSGMTTAATLVGVSGADQFGVPSSSRCATFSSSTANGVDFAVTGTSVDLLWAGGPSTGRLTWSVDGGVTTNVDTFKVAVTASNKTRITFGSAGAHTVSVRWASGGTVYVEGVMSYYGDESLGVRIWDAGRYGWNTSNWATSVQANPHWATSVGVVQPSLVVIELMANDYNGNIAPATVTSNLQTIIAQTKAACTLPPSFVIVAPYQRTGAYTYTWAQYVAAARAVTATDSAVLVADISQRMPPVAGDTLSLYDGNVHPLDKGHAMLADCMFGFIIDGA